MSHFVSTSCTGELCSGCLARGEGAGGGAVPATHKIGEEIMWDDPMKARHNLTAYVCCDCFSQMIAPCGGGALPSDVRLRCTVTKNPCGSDTWRLGHACQCTPCRQWVAAFEEGMASAALRANAVAGGGGNMLAGQFVWSGKVTLDNQAQPLNRICTTCSGSGIYVDYAGPNTGPSSTPCGACQGRGWLP